MKMKILLSAACVAALLTTGCAPKLGGDDYNIADVGDTTRSVPGKILSKRVVQLHASDPSKGGAGSSVGAGAGALIGSTIGQGNGGLLAMGVGAIAGGFGGHFAEQAATRQEGFAYQVQEDKTGEIRQITQGAEPNIPVGGLVYIIESVRTNDVTTIHEKRKSRARVVPR